MRLRDLLCCLMFFVIVLPVRGEGTATVLVSSAMLQGGYFNQTVVLIDRHGANRETIGVILNRPLGKTMGELFDLARDHPFYGIHVYRGGPVASEVAVGLIASEKRPPHSLEITDDIYITLDLKATEDEWDNLKVTNIRIFLGYAGWRRGQLDEELKRHSWKFGTVTTEDMFLEDTDNLWRKLHRRPAPRMVQDSHRNGPVSPLAFLRQRSRQCTMRAVTSFTRPALWTWKTDYRNGRDTRTSRGCSKGTPYPRYDEMLTMCAGKLALPSE